MNASLDLVLQHPGIWRGDRLAQAGADVLPTGFAELDEQLPGGGWPRGALTEILIEREGIGELRLRLEATGNGLAVHILKRRGGHLGRPVLVDLHQGNGIRRAHPSAPKLSVVQFPKQAARS
jgi:hypothetical protein